jgi:hypothetical protein
MGDKAVELDDFIEWKRDFGIIQQTGNITTILRGSSLIHGFTSPRTKDETAAKIATLSQEIDW